MLSIGKLTHIANTASKNLLSDNVADRTWALKCLRFRWHCLVAFHDPLDYVSVHEKLLQEIREPLIGVRARQSIENQVDLVVKNCATSLRLYPAFLSEFRLSVRALLQSHVLNIEDMVDVLTLKDKATDHSTALELIKNAKVKMVYNFLGDF